MDREGHWRDVDRMSAGLCVRGCGSASTMSGGSSALPEEADVARCASRTISQCAPYSATARSRTMSSAALQSCGALVGGRSEVMARAQMTIRRCTPTRIVKEIKEVEALFLMVVIWKDRMEVSGEVTVMMQTSSRCMIN